MDEATVQHVTPTTRALLRWWLRPRETTNGIGFQDSQRQAMLATVTAHEGIDGELFRQARPAHRLALAHGEQPLPVMLALMIWQLLNHIDTRAIGLHDPRFTDQFVFIAPDAEARGQLFDTLCGPRSPENGGKRDFARSELSRFAPLLMPTERHAEVFAFVLAHVGEDEEHLQKTATERVIAITDDRVQALECLARLPHAMVFDDETRPPYRDRREHLSVGTAWRRHLRRFASMRNGHGAQVLFTHPAPGDGRHRYTLSGPGAGTSRIVKGA